MFTKPELSGLEMPWRSIQAVLNGISAIDLSSMQIGSRDEAYDFVLSYGYDLHHPEDIVEIHTFQEKAVTFIRQHFLESEIPWLRDENYSLVSDQIPKKLLNEADTLDLILFASRKQPKLKKDGSDDPTLYEKHWACAILKVMNVIAHIENGLYYRELDAAREQILKNFYDIIRTDIFIIFKSHTTFLPRLDFGYFIFKSFERF